MRRSTITLPIAGLLAASALAACGDGSAADDGRLDVVAGFYPLAFATEQVGGDAVDVANLTPAGGEPHDLELGPSDIAAIEEADYVVYLEGFIPALDDAIAEYASDKALDISDEIELLGYDATESIEDEHAEADHAEDEHAEDEHAEEEHAEEDHAEEEGEEGHDHGELEGNDPHVWLDPTRYAQIGEVVADGLSQIDSDGADDYAAGAADFTTALDELDAEFTEGLADRATDDIVTSHAAFGYLADRYGLHQVAISGLSPDEEAGSQRMAEVASFIEDHGITTIFFETLVASDLADTIAAETGAQTATLNPLEGLTEDQIDAGDDYFSIMRENLAALQSALGTA